MDYTNPSGWVMIFLHHSVIYSGVVRVVWLVVCWSVAGWVE